MRTTKRGRGLAAAAGATALLCACAPPEDAIETTVFALQAGEVDAGVRVTVRDLVITGTGFIGFWAQDPAGGPQSGIWIEMDYFWRDFRPELVAGAQVTITAPYLEYDLLGSWADTVTELEGKSGAIEVTGEADAPSPAEVTFAELVDPTTAERWEGVVVAFAHDVVTESLDEGFGAWSVGDGDDTLLVQDSMFKPPALAIGDAFDGMAGVLQYSFSEFKLEPRSASDLQAPAQD